MGPSTSQAWISLRREFNAIDSGVEYVCVENVDGRLTSLVIISGVQSVYKANINGTTQ